MPSLTVADARRETGDCVALLKTLVECESPTGDPEGNLRAADLLEQAMVRAGGRVKRISAAGLGVHLVARFRGMSRDRGAILVAGHMDTVHPVGTLKRLPFAVTDGKVHGPGVYDMKSGLAVSLTALRVLAEMDRGPAADVTCLVTCDEEHGAPDSRELIEAEAEAHRAALVPEPSAPGGAVKSRRKGVSGYVLEVSGRAAHAGIEPEAGASATHELARQIGWICDLADPEAGTSVNVGVISGGTKANVVADAASCTIDVRFFSTREADRIDAALRAAVAFDRGCTLTLRGGLNRGALEKTEASSALFKQARALATTLGFELGEESTGGASDGNLIAAVGCPTLDGLGPDGRGAHTLVEHIFLDDVPRRIALMAGLLETL